MEEDEVRSAGRLQFVGVDLVEIRIVGRVRLDDRARPVAQPLQVDEGRLRHHHVHGSALENTHDRRRQVCERGSWPGVYRCRDVLGGAQSHGGNVPRDGGRGQQGENDGRRRDHPEAERSHRRASSRWRSETEEEPERQRLRREGDAPLADVSLLEDYE